MCDVVEDYPDFTDFGVDDFREFIDMCMIKEIEENAEQQKKAEFFCCNEEMNIGNNHSAICRKCMRTISIIGDLSIDHTNVEMQRIIPYGINAKQYKRSSYTLTNNSANYVKLRERALATMIEKMQSMSPNLKFTPEIKADARNLCMEVTATQIFRKDMLLEIIAASLEEACRKHNQIRRDSEFIAYVGLKSGGFSQARKILQQLRACGQIKTPEPPEDDDVGAIVGDFLRRINFDESYSDLIRDVIVKITDEMITTAILPSKCAAVIWILIKALKNDTFKIGDLESNFYVKQMTIINTALTLMKYRSRFEFLFEKHGITLSADLEIKPMKSIKNTAPTSVVPVITDLPSASSNMATPVKSKRGRKPKVVV